MKNIAVLISGSGTDMQSVIDACKAGKIDGRVCVVISSKDGVFGLTRAANEGIPSFVFKKKDYESPEALFGAISECLKAYEIDLIVLAGYLSILSPNLIAEYRNRIINIHPSLIPSFCGNGFYGLKVHSAVLEYGAKVSGATVHFVDEGADTGAIILQEAVPVKENDTPETLQARILEVEHQILPRAVALFCADQLKVEGRKVLITEDIDR